MGKRAGQSCDREYSDWYVDAGTMGLVCAIGQTPVIRYWGRKIPNIMQMASAQKERPLVVLDSSLRLAETSGTLWLLASRRYEVACAGLSGVSMLINREAR